VKFDPQRWFFCLIASSAFRHSAPGQAKKFVVVRSFALPAASVSQDLSSKLNAFFGHSQWSVATEGCAVPFSFESLKTMKTKRTKSKILQSTPGFQVGQKRLERQSPDQSPWLVSFPPHIKSQAWKAGSGSAQLGPSCGRG